jgi:hypothetical protein
MGASAAISSVWSWEAFWTSHWRGGAIVNVPGLQEFQKIVGAPFCEKQKASE